MQEINHQVQSLIKLTFQGPSQDLELNAKVQTMLSSRTSKKGGENLPASFKKKIQRENNDRIKTNLIEKLQAMEAEIQSHIPQQSNEFIMKFVNNKFRFESYLV